jgi:hypothetical protein
MSKITYLTMIFFLCISIAASAETEIVITKKNSFGGITKKINYSEEDHNYKTGIRQIIDYSDSHGNKRKIEIYTSKKHSQKLDLYMVIHYKSTGRVFEFFPSDRETGGQGVSKLVLYYNEKDELQKREYYFAKGSPISVLGVCRRVIYYDKVGGVTKVEHFDKNGKKVMQQ